MRTGLQHYTVGKLCSDCSVKVYSTIKKLSNPPVFGKLTVNPPVLKTWEIDLPSLYGVDATDTYRNFSSCLVVFSFAIHCRTAYVSVMLFRLALMRAVNVCAQQHWLLRLNDVPAYATTATMCHCVCKASVCVIET